MRARSRTKAGQAAELMTAVVVMVVASSSLGQTAGPGDRSVTAVQGESWIRHLRTSFNETSMGKTWALGPAPPSPGEAAAPWQLKLSPAYATQMTTLQGSDLYRLSCRGCHGAAGRGTPPEINSVIGPVQATSARAITERMKKAGREMRRSEVAAMAKDSKVLLLERLHSGGQHMLPPTLSEAEIPPLVSYLEELSDVPGAGKKGLTVKETSHRIGEHIVKSACHVCHSATGPNPDPEQILQGAIPPLSSLTTRVSLPEFVRKVTSGAPILMGKPATAYRGRMPVFGYLSQDEAAAAYLYLMLYPPRP